MTQVHVYLAEGFEEIEALSIIDILRRAGVSVASVALDEHCEVRGSHAITVRADLAFSQAVEAPAMIVLPGGPGTARLLASEALGERLRRQYAAGRLLAALCAAPRVLAAHGLLKGMKACCYPGCEADLVAGGAQILAHNVVTDGLITTSRGPGTSALFALELARLLAGEERAREVGRAMLVL